MSGCEVWREVWRHAVFSSRGVLLYSGMWRNHSRWQYQGRVYNTFMRRYDITALHNNKNKWKHLVSVGNWWLYYNVLYYSHLPPSLSIWSANKWLFIVDNGLFRPLGAYSDTTLSKITHVNIRYRRLIFTWVMEVFTLVLSSLQCHIL